MSNGSRFGRGIYLAKDLLKAKKYTGKYPQVGHWPKSRASRNAIIVALCEVVARCVIQYRDELRPT